MLRLEYISWEPNDKKTFHYRVFRFSVCIFSDDCIDNQIYHQILGHEVAMFHSISDHFDHGWLVFLDW